MKFTYKVTLINLIKTLLISLVLQTTHFACANSEYGYIAKPTGKYTVSMKQLSWTNSNICPDYFYKESDKWFYENTNGHVSNYCHRFNAYIFYPTTSNNKTYIPYYADSILEIKHDLNNTKIPANNLEIARDYIQHLNGINSYTLTDAPIASGKFPLIIFKPGLGFNSNNFQNIITNLVSHGYIVMAIDSTYSSTITKKNGYIEWGPLDIESGINPTIASISAALAPTNSYLSEAKSDCYSALEQLYKNQDTAKISQHIDHTHIGGLGHSMGGISLYQNSLDKHNSMKAMAIIDFGQSSNKPIHEYSPKIPTLIFRAANDIPYGIERHTANVFKLESRSYLVWMRPTESNLEYSKHYGFSDFITITNDLYVINTRNKIYNRPEVNHDEAFKYIGNANGFEFTSDINQYLLEFFDHNLKNTPAPNLEKCTNINSRSKLYCGPTVVK